MKNLPLPLLLFLIVAVANASHAQAAPATTKPSHDYCLMNDGKMMIIRGRKMLPMTEDMTMRDGTICRMDGSCTRKNGTIVQMKEGQHMMMNGKMMANSFVRKRP